MVRKQQPHALAQRLGAFFAAQTVADVVAPVAPRPRLPSPRSAGSPGNCWPRSAGRCSPRPVIWNVVAAIAVRTIRVRGAPPAGVAPRRSRRSCCWPPGWWRRPRCSPAPQRRSHSPEPTAVMSRLVNRVEGGAESSMSRMRENAQWHENRAGSRNVSRRSSAPFRHRIAPRPSRAACPSSRNADWRRACWAHSASRCSPRPVTRSAVPGAAA